MQSNKAREVLEMIENTKRTHHGFTINNTNLDKIKQNTGNSNKNENI